MKKLLPVGYSLVHAQTIPQSTYLVPEQQEAINHYPDDLFPILLVLFFDLLELGSPLVNDVLINWDILLDIEMIVTIMLGRNPSRSLNLSSATFRTVGANSGGTGS